ncbi:hypothetical protein [Nitrosomonas supralitoralis]|uniref:hypothetical protein n=1 Tax=Nitrosomonas supralitoralis TaxID=2116706 RepID=UPI0018D51B90|nr:hypothetical protein [Nitrosomonas supralitoralis]
MDRKFLVGYLFLFELFIQSKEKALYPPLLKQLWHTPLANAPEQEIVYRDYLRLSYCQVYARIQQFGAALAVDNVQRGDVIAVMDYDSHRYLEPRFSIRTF